MNEWWQTLEQRERILVSIMSVMIVGAMLYWFLLEPLFGGANDYRERVAAAESDLDWMKKIQPRLPRDGQAASPVAGKESLVSIVDTTTQQLGLKARSVQRSGADKVRAQFDQSPFENMVRWFGVLHEKHNVVVDTINITRDDTTGVVSGSVTIQKAVN